MASVPQAMPTGERLFDFATAHVNAMGRHFGDGADRHLRDMTHHAGAILDAVEDDDERTAQIEAAQASLIDLLDRAAAMARDLEDYPDDLLGERSFFPALAWFCPRFPFC